MRSMTYEQISVLMPVRNEEISVAAALVDLASQLNPDDQFLVVNDGSTDATPEILAKWQHKSQHVNVLNADGIGLVQALNLGLAQVSNKWVARADADDRYPADRLINQRAAIRSGAVAVTGDYRLVLPDGSFTQIPCALGPPFVRLSLLNPQRFPHPGVLFNRDAVLAAGVYREQDFPAEDLSLWLRLAEQGDLVGVPNVVVDWHLRPGSISHAKQDQQRAKTAELLKAADFSWVSTITREQVKGEIRLYRDASMRMERTLLLLRDLTCALAHGLSRQVLEPVVRELAVHPVSSTQAYRRLRRDAKVRARFRASLG